MKPSRETCGEIAKLRLIYGHAPHFQSSSPRKKCRSCLRTAVGYVSGLNIKPDDDGLSWWKPPSLRGALATKQSILSPGYLLCRAMDCFATLAMTIVLLFENRIPSHLSAGEKRQPLEQVHVLLVLQQRAVQRRDQLARIAFPEHFRRHVLVEQQFQPIQQLRGRGPLLSGPHLAD